ncbi:MAG: hypothetical protein Q9226_008702, partial [Calogaya cf. arnoldii]
MDSREQASLGPNSPSYGQNAGKETSDCEQTRSATFNPYSSSINMPPAYGQYVGGKTPTNEQSRSTIPKPYVCVYPGCTRSFARAYDLDRHMKVHFPGSVGKLDCPQGIKEGSFCKRVGELGFTRRDHLVEHMRKVHLVDVPRSARATQPGLNYNHRASGEMKQHNKRDNTTHSALATVVESQQHPQRQTEPQRQTDLRRSEPRRRKITTLMSSQFVPGYKPRSEIADSVPSLETSRSYSSGKRPLPIPLPQAVKGYPNSNSSVSSLDAMWDLNDDAIAVSSSGSSNLEDDTLAENKTGSNQRPSVSDMATTLVLEDSGDMAGVASQLTHEWVEKEAYSVQPADTPLDGVALGSRDKSVSTQQNPSQTCNTNDASLPRSQNIGQASHPSRHQNTEKPQIALKGKMPEEEAVFHSAVFHLDHHQYRKAKRVLRQLPRIHQKGNSDYKAKLYLLLAKAYKGEGQLDKAQDFAQVSFDERKDLYGDIHYLVEESACLLITILTELGNNSEADGLRKVHCPRRSYRAVFIDLALKVGATANSLSFSMILRKSLSLLEHTRPWLLNSRSVSFMRTVFPEKPLVAGKSCGQNLFDDFTETRPGAAEELRAALHT